MTAIDQGSSSQTYQSGLLFLPCRQPPKDSGASAAEIVTWDPPVEPDSSASFPSKTGRDESEQQREEEDEGAEFEAQLKLPAILKDLKVQVSHVNSPSSFYVQLAKNSGQLKRSVVVVSCCLTTR